MFLRRLYSSFIIPALCLLLGMGNEAGAAREECFFTGRATTATGAISFDSIDPSQSGTFYGTITAPVQFTCSAGTVFYTRPVAPLTFPSSGLFMSYGANPLGFTLNVNVSGTSASDTAVVDLLAGNSAWIDPTGPQGYQDAMGGGSPSSYSYTGTALQVDICWGNCQGGKKITATINVDGTLIDICSVAPLTGTMSFNMNPLISGITSAVVSPDLVIECTKGDTVTISSTSQNGAASPKLKCSTPLTCGVDEIFYTFSIANSITGSGFSGSGISLGINGFVNSTDYVNKPYGDYTDIETITVSY